MIKTIKYAKKLFPGMPSISSKANAQGGHDYVISIRGTIMSEDLFASSCDLLLSATDKDTVTILLNTPGGYVSTGISLIRCMSICRAPITTVAVGLVASCGAVIFSYGQTMKVSRFSKIMFHASSGGFIGKTRDQKDSADSIEKIMKKLVQPSVDKGLLTQEQFDQMFENKTDIYLTSQMLESVENVEVI